MDRQELSAGRKGFRDRILDLLKSAVEFYASEESASTAGNFLVRVSAERTHPSQRRVGTLKGEKQISQNRSFSASWICREGLAVCVMTPAEEL